MARFDGIIIGAGPNGLTTAAYLAKAGLRILVLERRFELGGGLCTEQVTLPGFLHNTHAVYHSMVDYAPIFHDLQLEDQYKVRFIHPELVMAMPFSDGRFLGIYSDLDKTCESIAQFSKKDAETYREIYVKYDTAMRKVIGPSTYLPSMPPIDHLVEMQKTEVGSFVIDITEKSPKEVVDELFENERVKALILYATCMWGLEHDQTGLGFLIPLYINRASNYRLCIGGSHYLASAISKVIYANGGMVLTAQNVKRILVQNGTATGVELEDGTVFEADKFVASSLDPEQTFIKLIGEENLDDDLAFSVKNWQWEEESLYVLHMALEEAPNFTAASSDPIFNQAFIYVMGYESDEEFIKHWEAVKKGEIMHSGFNACFPSVLDPIEAPKGYNVGLISEIAPYGLQEGGAEMWHNYHFREEHARQLRETLRRYAPNMTEDNVLMTYITTPLDIENKLWDMQKGGIKQGAYLSLQMGNFRPNQFCSQHRTPIDHFYVNGASTYSGGTVIFGPGYLAANAIAEDLGVEKWWKIPELDEDATF
ncbi:phytoene desaturase family protein [Thermodesulfobacteriota bacterium]